MSTGIADPTAYEGRDLEAMSFAENYHRWVADVFQPYLRGSVAEIGAGTGNFSKILLEAPIRSLYCLEPSTEMHRMLGARLENEDRAITECAFLLDVASSLENQFDTVIYNNVLEHVEDDRREIHVSRGIIKPGGHLCIFAPALPALYSSFDHAIGHYRRYRRSGLVRLLNEEGFEVLRARYMDVLGIAPWYVMYVLGRRTLQPSHARMYDRLVIPWLRRLESAIPPPFGKNLLVVARRP